MTRETKLQRRYSFHERRTRERSSANALRRAQKIVNLLLGELRKEMENNIVVSLKFQKKNHMKMKCWKVIGRTLKKKVLNFGLGIRKWR